MLRDAGRFALRIVADGPSCVRATLIGLVFAVEPGRRAMCRSATRDSGAAARSTDRPH